jgi:hypothetical protein
VDDHDGIIVYRRNSLHQCVLGQYQVSEVKMIDKIAHATMPRLKVVSICIVSFNYVSFSAVSCDENECRIFAGGKSSRRLQIIVDK